MSTRHCDAFRQGWAGAEPELPEGLEERLAAACTAARAAWVGVLLDDVRFVVAMAACLRRQADERRRDFDLSRALDGLHAADLYLACGCADGDAAALAVFEERFLSIEAVKRHLRRVDGVTAAFVDEVRQMVGARLLVAEPGEPPRIATYTASGALKNWVSITTRREALNLLRSDPARRQVPQEQAIAAALPVGSNPELDYLQARCRHAWRGAASDAISALPERERYLLRLHLLDHLTHDRIAVMYDVNQSTVTRWIQAAYEAIKQGTVTRLRERLRVTTAELKSLEAFVGSQLDLSLTRLLGDATGP